MGLGLLGGGLVALSLPPFGWWPLAPAGLAVLATALDGRPLRRRLLTGAAFGLGQFTVGLWWMGEFNLAGAVLAVAMESAFLAGAAALVPPGRGRFLALPATVVLAEAARGAVPFGGLPMAGVALGQVSGPLAPAARLGGGLGLAFLATVAGVALAAAASRRPVAAGVALAVLLAGGGAGRLVPDGGPPTASVAVAAVQGGGARGFRQADVDESTVFAAHLAASDGVRPPVTLVVWPEDVVDVEGPVAETPEGAALAALARRLGATVVAGVVEGVAPAAPGGTARFRNAAVAWNPEGTLGARYEKVHRVPFGEYIPARGFFARVADVSAVPRDAIAGRGPGLLATPAGDLGALISYEVFFADRGRAALRAGAQLLVVPTNAASFRTSQVPLQELAAARLRALETGRDLVQAAPTGASALVDRDGRVLARTTLGERQVLQGTVALRGGQTVYTVIGDGALLALAAAAGCGAWARAWSRRTGSPRRSRPRRGRARRARRRGDPRRPRRGTARGEGPPLRRRRVGRGRAGRPPRPARRTRTRRGPVRPLLHLRQGRGRGVAAGRRHGGRGLRRAALRLTGLGSSGGDFAETTFTSNVADILAAATWLAERATRYLPRP